MPERYLGQTLGRFRVDAVIGSGGFAWVYKGFDPELQIPVALKVLKPQYAGDETFEERFRREATTAAQLRHPNIVKIYAVGREGDAVYFAMDYLPQGLADRLSVMTTLPESMLIRVAIDVASALGFAHREGVIHRDIKTDNILFDDHGNAVVADFGIARAVSGYNEQTGTNMVVGTPQYFSPEQARGLTLDGRADLYSLGVTMFKAATGQLPFQGTDWYEIARQHVEDKPPRPRSINPGVSKRLEDVILRCLEKEAEDRFPTGEALCEELVQILAERGETAAIRSGFVTDGNTLATPATTQKRFARSFRRVLRDRQGYVAGGAAAALVVAFVAFRQQRSAPHPRSAGGLITLAPPSHPPPVTVGSPPPPAPPRLIVDAPEGAAVTIDGVVVGKGRWETDTLKSGEYRIGASVTPMAGCASTSDETRATVGGTGDVVVRLSPRPCGTLAIDGKPVGATFTVIQLRPTRDKKRDGTFPLKDPLLLPYGEYRIQSEARFCSQYRGEFRLDRKQPKVSKVIKLACGNG